MTATLKTAVVTGAGDSTGLAIASRLLASGLKVHICDIREQVLESAIADQPGLSGTVANVGKQEDVSRLFEEAREKLGIVDALVNVVGIPGAHALVEDIDPADWDEVMRVNVSGMLYCIQQVAAQMKEQKNGAIVNFSSGSTRTCLPNRTPYVVSKYAVEGLSKNLARELGPFNIRVNAILPGMINNARMQKIVDHNAAEKGITAEEMKAQYTRYISMRSSVETEELADMVDFLVSDKARHISGQLIGVDGNIEWEE